MKKKLALIIISLEECFPEKGFSGGGHKVTRKLIQGLISSNLFEIDVYCKKSGRKEFDGINSVKALADGIETKNYDYVLSSDVLLPFGNTVLHSNSSKYKTKNGKNRFLQQILRVYNAKKINKQEKAFKGIGNKAIFTVSQSLKNDYVTSYNLDENKVFVAYPAVDDCEDCQEQEIKNYFTIGSIAGGGLNKGGYLLLLALTRLKKTGKLKARIIFPKFHKAFFFKLAVKVLRLNDIIELLPKQAVMQAYYKSVDCYVLPSLNEAFGLVVTEAASNCKPSLVSSTTGVRELIKDGENGFVFNREKSPIKNLAEKLEEITELYFNDNKKFQEIAQGANKMVKELDWQAFTDTIITNMVAEKIVTTE